MRGFLAALLAALLALPLLFGAVHASQYEGALSSDVRVSTESGKSGSGVYVGNGMVVTAYHVVKDQHEDDQLGIDGDAPKVNPVADQAFVTFDRDGHHAESTGAHVLVWNPADDVAVLALDSVPEGLPAAKFACRDPKVDEPVSIVGYPFGVADVIRTHGYVSGKARRFWRWLHAVPIDGTIAPGNSGGPVFDANGDVLGLAIGIQGEDGKPGSINYMTTSPALCDWLAKVSVEEKK